MTPERDANQDPFVQARNALAAGNTALARTIVDAVLKNAPGNVVALNMRGNIAMRDQDFRLAQTTFESAARIDAAPQILLNLSAAANARGDVAGERDALERALAADPYFQLGLLQRARWHMAHSTRPKAAADYSRWLATISASQDAGPAMRDAIGEARSLIAADSAALFDAIGAEQGDGARSARFAECVDLLLGRKRRFHSAPTGLYIPFLPEIPFFDRAMFPWFDRLEEGAETMRQELLAVLSDDAGLEPYVAFGASQPVNQWAALNHSRDWSAFFLRRNGERIEENCAKCPLTSALLDSLPLLDLEGRGPTAMFSILKPDTHIPPHTGVTNSRAVIHLPLIVPPDCGFRVGATTRQWSAGTAWAFDDTIEHEAWNRSGEVRVILIIDAWNPFLDAEERDDIRALTRALERHAGREEWSV